MSRPIDAEILFEKVGNIKPKNKSEYELLGKFMNMITCSPTIAQRPHGECKTCKYFEYDHVDKVNGIPLITAHEICTRWGDGCKTSETGYCFLYEPKESGANNEV